jgi:hypothetical protein
MKAVRSISSVQEHITTSQRTWTFSWCHQYPNRTNSACRNWLILLYIRGAQIFKKSRNHVKLLGARRVIWSKFHNEGPHILCATEQKLFARAIWRPGFVRPCFLWTPACVYTRILGVKSRRNWLKKNVEGRNHGKFRGTLLKFPKRAIEKHEKSP